MAWPKIDPAIVAMLLDGAEEFAAWAWHKVSGDATDDKAKKAIAAMQRRMIEAAIRAGQDELEQQVAVANLAMQLVKLGSVVEGVLPAIDEAEKRAGLPHILEGAQVEIVTDPNWHPSDDEATPPMPPVKIEIILNGVRVSVAKAYLTYEQIVELAGKTGTPTVVFSSPSGNSGELLPGQTVAIENNSVVSAIHTDNA